MREVATIALLLASLILLVAGATGAPIIADHTSTHLNQIPKSALDHARSNLHIAYGHTSHGSQIISGMTGLMSFQNAPYGGKTYTWSDGISPGALDLDDYFVAGDLGNPDRTTWAQRTRDYLDNPANSDVNVVMWSWCGQVDATEAQIDTYLRLMNQLESEYPDVKFVYMTGHLDGGGADGNVNLRNEQIRRYVRANNKILYDFADIESYDPDQKTNYMKLYGTDACTFRLNGKTYNWATEWQNSHVKGKDWYSSRAAHSQSLNANQKAYAAWWLWARLGGWNGVPVTTNAVQATAAEKPDAGFTATPRSGTAPLTVQFRDTSAGSPSSWNWNFGDGSTADAARKNPVHTYAKAGTYTVTLKAANAAGSDTKTSTGYITVTSEDAKMTAADAGDLVGVFRPSTGKFYLDDNGNGKWNGDVTDFVLNFGLDGDMPVYGDWNKDATTEVGVFRPSAEQFYLDYNGNGEWNGGVTDRLYHFGNNGDIPVTGDWNADGKSEIGVFRPSAEQFYLDYNGNGKWNGGVTDRLYHFGNNGDIPVTGDWNADGKTEVGVLRAGHFWYLDYNGNGEWDGPVYDRYYGFGKPGDEPVTGDWNKDGKTEIGVFRPSAEQFYLDYNGSGWWSGRVTDRMYKFGNSGDIPVSGVWS